ncbi:MAG: hypothetical protein ACI936_002469, partial [Paraglaciecola sp.]
CIASFILAIWVMQVIRLRVFVNYLLDKISS